jgi:heme/copper-type cytochrome/quinol oxidase subunit 4
MTAPDTATDSNLGVARFMWKTVALWAVIIALVSLTVLAVVATIASADALSVVALALAVMAFVVQIIVFIVQGNAASQQAADTAALNAQTLRALATIEEKSEGTRETVGKISDRLLDFAFTKASAEAESAGSTEPAQALTAHVLERAKEIIKSSQDGNPRGNRQRVDEPSRGSAGQSTGLEGKPVAITSFLDDPLTAQEIEEAARLVEDLKDNKLTLVSLDRLGTDLKSAESAGRPQQAGMSSLNEPVALHEKGLIKRIRPTWTETPMFVLTDKGKLVAKALLTTPAPPNETIVKARRDVEDFTTRVARSREARQREEEVIPLSE